LGGYFQGGLFFRLWHPAGWYENEPEKRKAEKQTGNRQLLRKVLKSGWKYVNFQPGQSIFCSLFTDS